MNRIRIVVPLVAFSVCFLQSLAMGQPEEARPAASEVKPDLMGLPYDEAIEFVTRHTAGLRRVPGVETVSPGPDGIYVYTDQPERLPATFAGIPVKPLPPMQPRIQGRSHAEVDAILGRARRDLTHLPGVQDVTLGFDGIYVSTDQPELIPDELEGLPVKTLPFMGSVINDIPASKVEEIFWRHRETLRQLPGAREVSLGPDGIYVYTDQPEFLPDELEGVPVEPITLPSSPKEGASIGQGDPSVSSGVTILRGGGIREEAESCPRGMKELSGENGRRFCLDAVHPAFDEYYILSRLPVMGRPFEEVWAIVERHREELMALPGVQDVVISQAGVLVWTTGDFSAIPDSLEGIPLSPQRHSCTGPKDL